VLTGRLVERPARGNAMIAVDLFLQLVAKPQLIENTRCELADKPREPAPKLAGADIRSRQDLVADKVAQDFRNPDFADFLVSHHVQAIMWPDSRKILHGLIDETNVAEAIGGWRRIIVHAITHQRGRTACPLQAARRLNQWSTPLSPAPTPCRASDPCPPSARDSR
jgi:hypothetical protein